MSEPKPFASLSSGLLARKGAARPAMRPQGFGQAGQSLEDLGWDDMGFEPPKPVEAAGDPNHDSFGDTPAGEPRVHPTGLTPVQSSVPAAAASPVPSPVHSQQAELAARVAEVESFEAEVSETGNDEPAELQQAEPEFGSEPVVVRKPEPVAVAPVLTLASAQQRFPRPRAAAGSKAKAAFTLRLDPERHLKLRLACAVDGRSAQNIVTAALDHLLATMPELAGMAAKAHRKG
ncbi:MAG: hypothetical protein ABIS38_05490 [Sphingomicrobium sp.]